MQCRSRAGGRALKQLKPKSPAGDIILKNALTRLVHFTPTHASWLNQVEIWFSILSRRTLKGASFTSVKHLRQAIDAFVAAYNPTATPFQWRKAKVHPTGFAPRITDL